MCPGMGTNLSEVSSGTAPGLRLTWVEQDNGSQAPQLRLIHLHVFHFGHQLCQNPACGRQGWADDQRQVQTARLGAAKHLGLALGMSPILSAGRGSFEGQPSHTLLFYMCISSIHGPEHQIHSRSHFAQHVPSVLCLDYGEEFAFTWGKPHGFSSTFHCAKHRHCPYTCQLCKSGGTYPARQGAGMAQIVHVQPLHKQVGV